MTHLRYIVEARNEDGTLNLKAQQPPSNLLNASEDDLFRPFFAAHPAAQSASWDEVRAWYKEKGWTIRERYW